MAVSIDFHRSKPATPLATHPAAPTPGTTSSLPRGNSRFAALLAEAQAHVSRRASLPRASADGHSSLPHAASLDRTPKTQTAAQCRESPTGTASGSSVKTPDRPADKDPGSTPPNSAADAPAHAHAVGAAKTPLAKSASKDTELPAPVLPPAAAAPSPTQDAAVVALAQDAADQSAGEPSATTAMPSLAASPAPSIQAEPAAADIAPAESMASPGSKPADLPTPAVSAQEASATGGTPLPHAMPVAADESSSPSQAMPELAHIPPNASDIAEARETVVLRMAHAVQDGVQNISIDLHPADLGHVGIELAFHAGGVSVQMTLSRHETYEAFSRDRAALEQQLGQMGLDLGSGGLDLRFGERQEQPAFADASFATRLQPAQPDTPSPPAALPRKGYGLLNIIA